MVLKSIKQKKGLKYNEINKQKNKLEYKNFKKLNFNLRIVLILQLIIIFLPFSYMDLSL